MANELIGCREPESSFNSLRRGLLIRLTGSHNERRVKESRWVRSWMSSLSCGRHPALGSVTLSQLLATWAAHDLTHLHQVSRIMAHQYRAAVGPWSAYLGVLHCEGHSS
jgi:hypothetical protein